MKDAVTTYLNDHLAGSAAALELLDHLIAGERDQARARELEAIRGEIKQDQDVLLRILEGAGGTKSRVRTALAWLTEKLGEAKLRLDDPGSGQLQTFEALEALALGVQGKAALWRAMAVSQVTGGDWAGLERRALEQFARLEKLRIQAARIALSL